MSKNPANVSIAKATVADLHHSVGMVACNFKRLGNRPTHATPNRQQVQKNPQQSATQLQFHDTAPQLLTHNDKMLQSCAYKLSNDTDHIINRNHFVSHSEPTAGSIERL
jgi:hypothetical protein